MNNLIEIFSYPFLLRTFIVGILISVSAALIGTPLVLRRHSMLGDGLSHVAFAAFAAASIFHLAPLPFAIPIVLLVSFLILRLDRAAKLSSDTAIAVISTAALALGTFITSLAGSNVDINSYLFGSILVISNLELCLALILTLVIILFFTLFHHQIFALTFDESFARAIGIRTKLYNVLFSALCSLVIVLGMRLMGALLISGLIIFPTLSARTIFKSFKSVTLASTIVSVLCFFLGFILSYCLATPTGATIVLTHALILTISSLFDKPRQKNSPNSL